MKKIIALILIASISFSNGNVSVAHAEEAVVTEKASDINVIKVTGSADLEAHYENMSEVDVIYTHNMVFQEFQQETVREILDNGTDFFIANAQVEELVETYNSDITFEEEESDVIACYLTVEDAEYEVYPVCSDVIYEDAESISDEAYVEDKIELYKYLSYGVIQDLYEGVPQTFELTESEVSNHWVPSEDPYWVPSNMPYWVAEENRINVEEVYEAVHSIKQEDLLEQVTEEELARSKTSTVIGDAFCHSKKLIYFYKKGSADGTGSDYDYSSSTSMSGWSKMGSLDLGIYILKANTIGSATYNNVYSVVTASGLNDKYVTSSKVSVSVSALSTNIIMDHSKLVSGSSSTSGKLATSVNSSGSIPSSGYTTYAMNPGGQTISVDSSETYARTWTCKTPKATENGSWKVRPGLLLKKTNGTTTAVTGKVSVSYFQVSGGVRTYTIKDTVSLSIAFKNHAELT